MKITDFSIRHPVIITILLVALAVFGFITVSGMSQELFAQVDMPTLIVVTVYPGAGPDDVEREVTRVIENEVSNLTGISKISSRSMNSVSTVNIEFVWNTDIELKIGDLREKLNDVAKKLPSGINGAPQILRFSSSILPVYSMSVESGMDRQSLAEFTDDSIVPLLARIPGVAQVNVTGKAEMIVDIILRIDDLVSREVSILTVFQILQANNVALPAGSVIYQQNTLNIRTNGQYQSLDDIRNQVIGFKDNSYIRLSDVADVLLVEQRPDRYVTSGDRELVVIDIIKQQGADTVKLIRQVRAVCEGIKKTRATRSVLPQLMMTVIMSRSP
ncbi:efflux RND transporter permease subunit [Brucepastera parasyntrophica]|uniref:efflux RND transporter permease subunit n=1 Tax=Brucepastera parasyntrophica TaxID=2880008 RepID=UPI00210ED003|nr:efflux RND transporter permease subunit [Brucepastera parasyntrophica]